MSWTATPCGRRRATPAGPNDPLALPQFVADFGEQFGFGRARRCLFATLLHLVRGADDEEDDEGEDEEVDEDGDELAPAEDRCSSGLEIGVAFRRPFEPFGNGA